MRKVPLWLASLPCGGGGKSQLFVSLQHEGCSERTYSRVTAAPNGTAARMPGKHRSYECSQRGPHTKNSKFTTQEAFMPTTTKQLMIGAAAVCVAATGLFAWSQAGLAQTPA